MSHSLAVMTSPKSDIHYTPLEVIELVHLFWPQGIDLDPASDEVANQLVKAKRIYTESNNGLDFAWNADTVFINPPYSLVSKFIDKLRVSLLSVDGPIEAITLTKADTSTQWFKLIWENASAICFVNHRLQFWKSDITANQCNLFKEPDPVFENQASAPFCSAIAYFGSDPHRFSCLFSRLGPVAINWVGVHKHD